MRHILCDMLDINVLLVFSSYFPTVKESVPKTRQQYGNFREVVPFACHRRRLQSNQFIDIIIFSPTLLIYIMGECLSVRFRMRCLVNKR